MFYVYVLQSIKTGRRYVGSCENLDERVRRHNLGHSKATRHGVPWTLMHIESFSSRADATRKELYYKSGRGRDELDRLSVVRSPRRQVRGFKSRRPDFSLCMTQDDSKHICCLRGENVPSPALVTLAVFIGDASQQDGAQAIFCHKKCLRDRISKSVTASS